MLGSSGPGYLLLHFVVIQNRQIGASRPARASFVPEAQIGDRVAHALEHEQRCVTIAGYGQHARSADLAASSSQPTYRPSRTRTAVLCRRRVPILTVGSHVQPRQRGSHGGVRRAARKAMARVSDNGPLSRLKLLRGCAPRGPRRAQARQQLATTAPGRGDRHRASWRPAPGGW